MQGVFLKFAFYIKKHRQTQLIFCRNKTKKYRHLPVFFYIIWNPVQKVAVLETERVY